MLQVVTLLLVSLVWGANTTYALTNDTTASAASTTAQVSAKTPAKATKKKKRAKTSAAPVASSATPDSAITAMPEGVVKEFAVEGNHRVEKDAVIEKITTKVGEALDRAKVRQDIINIHHMGYFDSVEVHFDQGKYLVKVKEHPSISRILFFGNDQVDTDDLKPVLTVKTYDLYDENLVRESVRKLTKLYEDKGFYLAKINYETRYSKSREEVELLFNVREYDKVRVRKITFLGNTAFSDDQLKRTLRGTAEGGFFSWLTSSGNFKELDFKNDLQILSYWYLNEGHIRFKYDPPVVTVSEDKKWVYITIRVHEGPKYHISTVDFGGDLLFPKEELHEVLTLKEGDLFRISKRNADVLKLTEKYQDLGYANVNVVPNMDPIDDTNLTVPLNYEFEKGTLVHFGRITIKGNTKTRDKVIRRELKIREGELYTGTGFRESKENVERLGFFENNSVELHTSSPNGRPDIMDVEVAIKEHPTGQFQLGAGYSTNTHFFFTTSVAETNFLGRGQDLRFQAQIAADRRNRSFSVGFTDPYAFDTEWSLGGDIYHNVSTVPAAYTEYRTGLGLRVGHPVGEYTRLFLGYRLEKTILRDIVDTNYYVLDNSARENGLLSSVTSTIQYDKRNNRMEPTKGSFASASEEFAGLGGNRKFARTILDTRYYHSVIEDLVFRTKMELGNVYNYTNEDVQTGERFRLGGPNSLKGYDSFAVAPIKSYKSPSTGAITDLQLGALNEAFYVAELEYPIVKDVGLKFVLFYDIGDAFDKYTDFSAKSSYGWGVRWFSPLGPLRFEWGYPIKPFPKDTGSTGSVFNFMIGPPF